MIVEETLRRKNDCCRLSPKLLPELGEHKAIVFLRQVAGEASFAIISDQALGFAIASEAFETPSAGFFECLRVFRHNANQFALIFLNGFAALFVALNGTEETSKALPLLAGEDEIAMRRRQYLQLAGEQLQADAKLLSVAAPLDSPSLKCGLEQTLARNARKDSTDLEAEGLFIPATVREVNAKRLLKGVRDMDQTTLKAWAEKAAGIEEALAASKKEGSEALSAWLNQP